MWTTFNERESSRRAGGTYGGDAPGRLFAAERRGSRRSESCAEGERLTRPGTMRVVAAPGGGVHELCQLRARNAGEDDRVDHQHLYEDLLHHRWADLPFVPRH